MHALVFSQNQPQAPFFLKYYLCCITRQHNTLEGKSYCIHPLLRTVYDLIDAADEKLTLAWLILFLWVLARDGFGIAVIENNNLWGEILDNKFKKCIILQNTKHSE